MSKRWQTQAGRTGKADSFHGAGRYSFVAVTARLRQIQLHGQVEATFNTKRAKKHN